MDELDLLVAEQLHERHVLVRHRDEPRVDPGLVGVAPVEPGQLLVLATPGAHQVPSLVFALPELLVDFLDGIESVWVGIGSLATSTEAVEHLAAELDVEIVAPDGGVAAMPGAALYAGHSAGGTGWYAAGEFLGARFPLPEWESWLPATPVLVDDIKATPVPCGMVIADDVDHEVPVNQRFPKIVVGAPVPSAAAVAALLAELPDKPVMIVPAAPGAAKHTWLVELALRLGREIVFSAGTQVRTRSGALSTIVPGTAGNRLFRPFPLVLSQDARGGDQQVLDIAAAPPGWERDGKRSYRRADIVADVVPSGLALRTAEEEPDRSTEAAPFDPSSWTLTLGTSERTVSLPVLTAAEELLAVLPAGQRAVARVRMAGALDADAERALDRFSGGRKRPATTPDPMSKADDQVPGLLAGPAKASVDGATVRHEHGRPTPPLALGAVPPAAAGPMPAADGPRMPGGSVVPTFERPVRMTRPAGDTSQPPADGPPKPAVAPGAVAGPPGSPRRGPTAAPMTPVAPSAPAAGPAGGAVSESRPTPPEASGARVPTVVPPVVTMSGTPVSTVPGAPAAARQERAAAPAESDARAGKHRSGVDSATIRLDARQDAQPARPPVAEVAQPPAARRAPLDPTPPTGPAAGPQVAPLTGPTPRVAPPAQFVPRVVPPAQSAPPVAAAAQAASRVVPAQAVPPAGSSREAARRPATPPGRPLAVPARASTAAEQARFTSAAGDSFAEALAIVNAAMATWPSMRADESFGAKADYVAVCLFLGRGDGGAGVLNDALRAGQSGLLDAQVPCLMSGIRRLPTHRRAVLRQGKANVSLEHVSTPGTVLTEPGFLAGSIEMDVTLPGTDLDVLIWPSTARRTSELLLGRPVEEAVFLAEARFKALAVRTAEDKTDEEETEGPVAPRVAVLYRELAPGEKPTTTELDERDLAVLAKLDSVLARRHRGSLRLVEDPDVVARLTNSMVMWQPEAAAAVAS